MDNKRKEMNIILCSTMARFRRCDFNDQSQAHNISSYSSSLVKCLNVGDRCDSE